MCIARVALFRGFFGGRSMKGYFVVDEKHERHVG